MQCSAAAALTDSDFRGLVYIGMSSNRIKQEQISKNEPKHIKNKVSKKENPWSGSTPTLRHTHIIPDVSGVARVRLPCSQFCA